MTTTKRTLGTIGYLFIAGAVLLVCPRSAGAQTDDPCVVTGAETVRAEHPHYLPFETVRLSGRGYGPSCDFKVEVAGPAGTSGVLATTDGAGNLAATYDLGADTGGYTVSVLAAGRRRGGIGRVHQRDVRDGRQGGVRAPRSGDDQRPRLAARRDRQPSARGAAGDTPVPDPDRDGGRDGQLRQQVVFPRAARCRRGVHAHGDRLARHRSGRRSATRRSRSIRHPRARARATSRRASPFRTRSATGTTASWSCPSPRGPTRRRT